MDKRYIAAKERLSQLTDDELYRIITDIDHICFDTYNFDSSTNTFCPIAVAMNLHNKILFPTDEYIKGILAERFNPVNIFKGLEGNFYTSNRREDLYQLCFEIYAERIFAK